MIFTTERLLVRKLSFEDLASFHKMQSNPKVMRFVSIKAMTYQENKKDLKEVIEKYDKPNNDFWIYAVEHKFDKAFIGTIAFVKENANDEIGCRFLEKYWGKGYGSEIINGMILYAKEINLPKLIAYVSPNNNASEKMLKNVGFEFVESVFCEELQISENKYSLAL